MGEEQGGGREGARSKMASKFDAGHVRLRSSSDMIDPYCTWFCLHLNLTGEVS